MFTYANIKDQQITMTTFGVYYKCAHVLYSMEAPRRLAAKSQAEYLLLLNTLGKVPGSVVESIGCDHPNPDPQPPFTVLRCPWGGAEGWVRCSSKHSDASGVQCMVSGRGLLTGYFLFYILSVILVFLIIPSFFCVFNSKILPRK